MNLRAIVLAGVVLRMVILTGPVIAAECTAPASWFPHSQTPAPDNTVEPQFDCDFHRWEWQTFLWLTQATGPDSRLRFESFPTPADLFLADGPPAFANLPKKGALVLTPRVPKNVGPTALDEINQAGTNGVLIHRDERAVYFSTYVNQVFYDFVKNAGYYKAEKYLAAPEETNYPIGAMELKASWRIVREGESREGVYVREAEINLLSEKDGKVVVDPMQKEKVNVALVGLHIVGVVEGHPEFIWATFEHNANAPDLPAGMSPGSTQAVSDKDWTFYRKGTAAMDCNLNNATKIKLIDPMTQKVNPVVDVFRQFPSGGGKDDNVRAIRSLNTSVHGQLETDSVWRNYDLIGGVWLVPGQLRPGKSYPPTSDVIRGSVNLSNTTMETFSQQGMSCLTCHNSLAVSSGGAQIDAKNLNLSHIMTDGIAAQLQAKSMMSATKRRRR